MTDSNLKTGPLYKDVYHSRYQDYVIEILKQQSDYFRKRHLWRDGDDVAAIAKALAQKMGSEDFTWSMCWKPAFYADLAYEGFLSIGSELGSDLCCLMPKLHTERCVLLLENLHISKKTRKRCKNYTLSVDTQFEEVLKQCHLYHEQSWLYEPMQTCLRVLHKYPHKNLQVHSVELIDKDGKLVAGEIGITVGRIYTSLTGYYHEKGAGTIQLQLLGCLLVNSGFTMWDLGMWLDYKGDLGAKKMPRKEFLVRFRIARIQNPPEDGVPFVNILNGRELMNTYQTRKKPPLGAKAKVNSKSKQKKKIAEKVVTPKKGASAEEI